VARIEEAAVVILSDGIEEILSPWIRWWSRLVLRPREELKAFLKNSGIPYFVVGDALNPRRIIEATEEGAKAAWRLS